MRDYFKLRHALADLMQDHAALERSFDDRKAHADASYESGDLSRALQEYEALIAERPREPALRRAVARVLAKQEHHKEASLSLLQSLELEPTSPVAHQQFGAALAFLDDVGDVARQYAVILGLDSFDQRHLTAQQWLIAAHGECLRRCTEAADASAYLALGHLAMALQHMDEAVAAYEAANERSAGWENAFVLADARDLLGDVGEAHLVRGRAHFGRGSYGKAIRELEKGIALGRPELEDFARLAKAYNENEAHETAERVCRAAAERLGTSPSLGQAWSNALLGLNRIEEGKEVAERVAQEQEDPLLMLHERCLSLPVLYGDRAHLEQARRDFEGGLERWGAAIERHWDEAVCRSAELVQTNFYLHYQARDDVGLLARHGTWIQRLMDAAYPAFRVRPAMPGTAGSTRIRVGYLSADLRMHSVGKIIYGWLSHHDRSRFEIFSYLLATKPDPMARQFALASDHFRVLPEDIAQVAERVRADDLHILVHPSIGMYPVSTRLAAMRLAPIQCAALGHPVTTGLPSIDYFISSDLMEPSDADRHYTESLVRLPGVGISVPPPYLAGPSATRAMLGLPEEGVLLLSSQPVFKYLPQYDELFVRIAQRVPDARLVFSEGSVPELASSLRARIEAAFRRTGVDPEGRLHFLPPLPHGDYLQVNRLCDLFLDTIGWSGGVSTLDALGCGLPVVTMPGEFLRGRQSFGMLSTLGITETIARDPEQYVEIAVRLAQDVEARQRLRESILARHDLLYGDVKCVRGLEQFYLRAVEDAC